ncbi:F-box domain containing protein [Tanacetum coccineum]
MIAMVLWTINDFPARSSLSGWSGQGYKACPTCNKDTPSVRVLSKTTYVGHKRFLKKPHKWRSSREFNGQTDNRDPPKEFGRDEILAQLDRLPTRLTGKHLSYGDVKIKRNVLIELNWTKRSIFYELEYWSFLTLRHNLDIMHIEKNVLEAILNTLLMNDKSKDTAKARQDKQSWHHRSGLWLTRNQKRNLEPQAAYSFTPENRKKFCQYIKGVKLPDGFGSCFKHKVTDNDTNIALISDRTRTGPSFKSLFPNKDMKEEFPVWFGSQIRQRHVDNDKEPELQEILEFKYLLFKVVLFRVKWFDTRNQGRKVKRLVLRNNMTQIDTRAEAFKDDQYILVTQVKQVFYLEDKAKPYWRVVEHVNHKKFSDRGVIVVEDDPDIIHFDNSSDLPLSTNDDITDDEDALPHDLADSDDEDLINVDDDGVDKMSADVARSHGGDGGGEDRPPPHHVPTGCMGCFANRGKGKRKPNLGGRAAGRLNTRDKTRNLSLKEITDKKGPVPIRFELRDKQTLMPLGDHAAHWSSYIGEVIRGVPLYYPSWLKVPKERKAALITDIGTQFDLRPHMESPDWTEINAGIQQHLQKAAQALRSTRRSLTPSSWHTLLTGNSFRMRTDEKMRRLEGTGTYTDDEIKRLARRGKQRGHIPGVGRVLPARATAGPSGASGSGGCGDDVESADDQEDEEEDGDGDS